MTILSRASVIPIHLKYTKKDCWIATIFTNKGRIRDISSIPEFAVQYVLGNLYDRPGDILVETPLESASSASGAYMFFDPKVCEAIATGKESHEINYHFISSMLMLVRMVAEHNAKRKKRR